MPVIETETITRRKIVEGTVHLDGYVTIDVVELGDRTGNPMIEISHDGGAFFSPTALREAAALFTEMADILEKVE